MSFKFNPFTGQFDQTDKPRGLFGWLTRFWCGDLGDLDPDYYNAIDCRDLSTTDVQQCIDLGEL